MHGPAVCLVRAEAQRHNCQHHITLLFPSCFAFLALFNGALELMSMHFVPKVAFAPKETLDVIHQEVHLLTWQPESL